ncbi:MAG: hypothetical protein IJM30_11990 [Thermoguttaceae bacterium]|nr:hypothetical protein [Thermoguttaceae bacterium]
MSRYKRKTVSTFLPLIFALATSLALGSDAKDWGSPESFAVVNPVVKSDFCKTISLSGEWSFMTERPETYRLSVGEGVWGKFPYDWSKARKINVPGPWEAQGVGEPGHCRVWDPSWDCGTWDLQSVYAGWGLYRRTFELPSEWSKGRVWLKVGGVGSNAYIWINGKRAAYVETYCGARKYDVTDCVSFDGENEITALARNDVPSRLGLFDDNEHFGGFFRDVEMESTPSLYVDDVWARGDFKTNSADVRVYVKQIGDDGKPFPLYDDELTPNDRDKLEELRVNGVNLRGNVGQIPTLGSVELTIKTLDGKVLAKERQDAELREGENGLPAPIRFGVPIENCQYWTPENPVLYIADVVIYDKDGNAVHGWTDRFGVREFKVVGDRFNLNGLPYFLRGGGDHNYDQINLFEPPNRDRFREHMTIYKNAGFNYMRFHTHCPMPEYFESADEKGILLQPELPYYHDVTCEGFPFNPKRDMYELFRTNRRYVSFATYSYGNEGYLGSPVDKQLYSWVKRYDPDRLVIHQDGGTANKPGAADYTTNGANGASIINPWTPGDHDDVTVPFVAHEYLNLSIKMDPRLESRFTGIRVPPVSVAAWKEKLESVGLNEDWGAKCIAAAEKLQSIYQKRGLEVARVDSKCDGYVFWSLVDASIPQGSCVAAQGYLNPFWEPRPNGWSPSEFYRFNGPTAALLTTDLSAPVIVAGNSFVADFRLSHFDASPLPEGELVWEARSKADGKVVMGGSIPFKTIEPGFAGVLASKTIDVPLDVVSEPTAVDFVLSIKGTDIVNSWDYWIFPKREKRSLKGFAVSGALYDRFAELFDDVKRIPSLKDADPNDGDVWITTPSEPAYYAALTTGRKTFVISPAVQTPNVSLGWWSLGTQVGAALADSKAFAKFPNSSAMDELWFRLVRADAPDLAARPLGERCEPLFVGEGRDSYYLYLGQTKFGDAKVLASYALDLTQDAPEATALLDSLLAYVGSDDFDPKTESASLQVVGYEVPDGAVWGIDEILETRDVDSMPWKTLYEESAANPSCRQLSKESEIVWNTAKIDADDSAKTVTFAFIGGLGYWSEPKTDGFALSLNGKQILTFDLPDKGAKVGDSVEWKGESGAVLKLDLGRVEQMGPDFFGVFYLTVPKEAATSNGDRATLSARSLGENSRRWFSPALYPGVMKTARIGKGE